MKLKKLLAAVLSVVILFGVLPFATFTANAETSGYYTYSISDGVATITDCDTSVSGDLTIPSILDGCAVTTIGEYAFRSCEKLTSIIIPDSVISIGKGAFYGCDSLESITLPFVGGKETNYKYLGYIFGAWSEIYSDDYVPTTLKSVVLSSRCTEISSYAFCNCTSLTDMTLPNGITQIHSYLFSNCSALTKITIPDSVKYIGAVHFPVAVH